MVLNDEQNDRFFDTMDALLYYVNERFHVVENFRLEGASPLDDVKSSLVAHTLWENVEIIDDFVRDYANRLPVKCRELALSWKSALPGFYTLVRYQSGRALLMNEAGVFSVCGVTYELEGEIGPAPAYVEMVLLPFDDLIVYDGFLQAYDTDRSAAELQRIQDEFENRCAKGIALTGPDFMRQADTFLAEKRDRELDALLADVARESERGTEQLPAGFHRGALAGLSPDERNQALYAKAAESAADYAPSQREFDRRVRKREPIRALRDCLMLKTKAELEYVAQALGMGGLSRLRKAEMVEELSAELPNAPEPLMEVLAIASDPNYELIRRLAAGGEVTFGAEALTSYWLVWPIEPYAFLFKSGQTYTALIPDELKALVRGVDFAELDRIRRQRKQAYSCVEACTVLCGVVSIDDAYDQYRSLVSDVLSREEFEVLLQTVSAFGDAIFDLWTYLPTDYVVHYTLSPDHVAREFARRKNDAVTHLYRDRQTGEISTDPLNRYIDRMASDLRTELEELEQYKRDLVESQTLLPIKPLSRTILENSVMDELLDNPNVVRLRSFLDERVPDGEDDYTFVDRVVEEVVYSSVESGSLQDLFAYMMDVGLVDCSEDEQRLPTLLTNVYNAMPSWENNGWSPQELYEQVTGRKMFYNEDGTVMKVGADDPCPCGSGKKYRECCGR